MHMGNENDDNETFNVFGYEVDRSDAASAAIIAGGLIRANAKRNENAQKADMAKREHLRQAEISRAKQEEENQRELFDKEHDPCPYCHTEISKMASLCPSCRNGFFGIPWGLINLAITKNPLLIEQVGAEKLLAAVEPLRADFEAKLQADETTRKMAQVKKDEIFQKQMVERKAAAEVEMEKARLSNNQKYFYYGLGAAAFAVLMGLGALSGGGLGPLLWTAAAGYGSYYFLKKSEHFSGNKKGHWSEKK